MHLYIKFKALLTARPNAKWDMKENKLGNIDRNNLNG